VLIDQVLSASVRTPFWLVAIGFGLMVGWWACTVTARATRIADPGFIVWDEVLAIWMVLWLIAPASWGLQLLVFALFRYFDAAKPGPVRWADQVFKGEGWRGGFGILFDDVVAAGCTVLTLAVLIRGASWLGWVLR
jgi:phosphatidylglycerophosphatase A